MAVFGQPLEDPKDKPLRCPFRRRPGRLLRRHLHPVSRSAGPGHRRLPAIPGLPGPGPRGLVAGPARAATAEAGRPGAAGYLRCSERQKGARQVLFCLDG